MSNYKLNYKRSQPDDRNYRVVFRKQAAKTVSKATTPKTVDLSSKQTSVKDQGAIGSCTAFACVALMEYMRNVFAKNIIQDVYSEKFTYYVTRVDVAKGTTADDGAYVQDAFKSIRVYGSCIESLCPYDRNYTAKPSTTAYQNASKNQVIAYAMLDNNNPNTMISNMKRTIDAGRCFVGGFNCYESIFDSFTSKTGIISAPYGEIIGGHCVCFVGYDDKRDLLKFKNSWSNGWGDKGYGYLPYSYVLRGDLYDCWTIFTQENFSDTSVIGFITTSSKQSMDLPELPELPQQATNKSKKSAYPIPRKPKKNSLRIHH